MANCIVVLKGEEIQTAINALDFYSRIHIGQFKEVLEVLRWNSKMPTDFDIENDITKELRIIREMIYPELGPCLEGSYGIFNPKVQNTAGLAYNMYQVIRYYYSYALHPEGGYTVDFNSPVATGSDPLPACSIEKDASDTWIVYLTLSDKYKTVLKNALKMKEDLLAFEIADIFGQCSNNPQVLLHANFIKEWVMEMGLDKNDEEMRITEGMMKALE